MFKKILKWTLFTLLGFVLLLGALFGALQTGFVKNLLVSKLAETLSGAEPYEVAIGRLSGVIPFNFQLDSLRIEDPEGELLLVREFAFRMEPAALLAGRLSVRELRAGLISLGRLPDAGTPQEKTQTALPEWPPDLPRVIVHSVDIKKLDLGKEVLGTPASFSIHGSMRSDREASIAARFAVRRTDGPKAFAEIDARVLGTEPLLDLSLTARDLDGGTLSLILNRAEPVPFEFSLKGTGPVTHWRGDLKTRAHGFGSIESDLRMGTVKDRPALGASGSFEAAPGLIPQEVRSVLEKPAGRFEVDVRFEAGGSLVIRQARLMTDAADLELAGTVDPKAGTLDTEYGLRVPDLSVLQGIAGMELGGRAGITGSVEGPFENLMVRLSGDFEDLVHPYGSVYDSRGFRVDVSARIQKNGVIPLEKFVISDENLRIFFEGSADVRDLSFGGGLELDVRDLSKFAGAAGADIGGALQLRAEELSLDVRGKTASAAVHGALRGLSPVPPAALALLGNTLTFETRLKVNDFREVHATGLRLLAAGARMTGKASLDLEEKNIFAESRLTIPKLAGLSRPLGRKIAGDLSVDLLVNGSLASPLIQAEVRSSSIVIDENRVEQPSLNIKLTALEKPQGDFKAALTYMDLPIKAAGGFLMEEPNGIRLSSLRLEGPGTEILGDLLADPEGPSVKGTLNGRVDLASMVSTLTGEQIQGKTRFTAEFTQGVQGQEAALDIQAQSLEAAQGRAESLKVKASLTALFEKPTGRVRVELASTSTGSLELASAVVSVKGAMDDFSYDLRASGTSGGDFQVRAAGAARGSPKDFHLEISTFNGRFQDQEMVLVKPLEVNGDSTSLVLEQVDFRMGGGTLKAHGAVRSGVHQWKVLVSDLPLSIARLAGAPELGGTAEARLEITGTSSEPVATLDVEIQGARLTDPAYQAVPALRLEMNGAVRGGRAEAELSVTGLGEEPLASRVALPVNLSLSPWTFSVPPGGRVTGSLNGEIPLEPVPAYLRLEGQRVQGSLVIQAKLEGTTADPRPTGTIHLKSGSYENLETGTVLEDMAVSLKMADQKLTIEEARARAGPDGLLTVHGVVEILPEKGFPFLFEVSMEKARLAQRDDLLISAGGGVRLSGTLEHAAVSGDLTVEQAELRIPDRLPPDIQELDVVEVNAPEKSRAAEVPPEEGSGEATAITLDIRVNIPAKAFIRGRGIDSEWQGTLRVSGTADEPVIRGSLSVVRGKFDLFARRFQITRGTFLFDGSVPPAPRFELRAEHGRKDLTAVVTVSGTPSSLKLELSSEPPLPSDEILAHVLFNRGTGSINPIQALKLANALSALSGGGSAFDVMDRTRKLIGVDTLEIKQSEEASEETSAAVGKYLGENVYMEVEKGLNSEGGKVNVEVEVTPNITVESEAGSDASGGVGILWKWDY